MPHEVSQQITQVLVSLAFLLVAVAVVRTPNVIATTREGGLEALKQIQEWSKWMAGIQTAGFAALALLVLDKNGAAAQELGNPAMRLAAIAGFVYLGAALFCTAWVLSALPSQAIRLYSHHTTPGDLEIEFDIYEQPLFGWSSGVSLAYMLALKHWLWAIGLLAVAAYCLQLLALQVPSESHRQMPAQVPSCTCAIQIPSK